MKILLCNSSFGGGGITSYAHEVIKCLKDQHEISVMVGCDAQNPILYNDVNVYRYEMSDTSVTNAKVVLKAINEEIRPDVIINSNAFLISLLTPYIANHIKVISVSHALKYNDADVAGFNAQYIDAIVALSQHGKDYLNDRFDIHNTDKIKVVSNFVQENIRRMDWFLDKIERRTLNIVFCGGGSAVKSPDIVACVVSELLKTDLDFKFYWLGNTKPPLHSINVLNDIKQLFNTDDRLIFTGRVPREEAKRIIGEANIFLFPSIREGCPMSLLEAMSVGTIPLVADFPQVNIEIIKDHKNGFIVNHKSPKDFVKLITTIILDHGRYREIYNSSYQTYKSSFSYPIWVQNMNRLLNSLTFDHQTRLNMFEVDDYKRLEKQFRMMLKQDTLSAYLHESIPVSLSLIKTYLKNKIS